MEGAPEAPRGAMAGLSARRTAVQNRAPNPVQITAEQLLREAVERQAEEARAPAAPRLAGPAELAEYRVRKRKEFEDALRHGRHALGAWIKYAEWEAAQLEFARARSVFERALQVEPQHAGLWSKYIEMEIRNKFVNAARNLFDRVTGLLPRQDQFWLKYTFLEETLRNYVGARAVFERWMKWDPPDQAWLTYAHFEERCREVGLARRVFERYLVAKPSKDSFVRFAKFEEKHKDVARARAAFEKAFQVLPKAELTEDFYIKFIDFEERQREYDRVDAIYKSGIEALPDSTLLKKRYLAFQKQRGNKTLVEKAVADRRREEYLKVLEQSPYDYDTWFDLLALEEKYGADVMRTRETYEKAVAVEPPNREKKMYWRRYIYLWFFYTVFEESLGDESCRDRSRAIFERLADLVPHKHFSFAKLWVLWAQLELRRRDLAAARKVLGRGIGECGKASIFVYYIDLEWKLGNMDRCRILANKFARARPRECRLWTQALSDTERKSLAIQKIAEPESKPPPQAG